MKLRIKGILLDFGFSGFDFNSSKAGGRTKEKIHFTAAPEATLTYALESALRPSPVTVRYGSREVTVILSKDRARIWGGQSEVGVYTTLDMGPAGSLEVVVEKDFACLDRSDENNSDAFANPLAGATC